MNSTNLCRTCLNGNIKDQMQYLYDTVTIHSVDNPVTSITTTTLSEMLTTITTTTISKSDQLPTNICRKCSDNIKSFFEFKKKCEKSFDTLKIMLKENASENVVKKASITMPDSIYDNDNDDSDVGIEDWPPFENEIRLTRQDQLHETGPNDKQTQTEEFLFHPCEVCNEKFIDQRSLKKHRSGHIDKKCRICNKEFITFSSLRRHLRNVHSMNALSEKFDEIKCKECNKLFRNNTMFIQHLESYTNCGSNLENIENAKRITDAKIKRKQQIEINASKCGLITVHMNVNGQWECSNCKNLYDNENELRKHHCILNIKLTGTTPTKTETGDVNNIVKTENNIEPLALMNIIYKNPVVKQEHNNDCNPNFEIVFPDTASLNNVDAEFKNDLDDLDCKSDYDNNYHNDKSDCDDDYNPKKRIKRKKRTNKNVAEKSHRKTTSNPIELNYHQSTSPTILLKSTPIVAIEKRQKTLAKKIKISCNLCKLKFIDFEAFARHKKSHTTLKQKIRHICEVCNKEYSRKHALTRHRTMQHSDATPYECNICKKAFKIQYYLTLHKLVHSEDRLHCNICDIKFKCALDLTVHRKKQHMEEYRRPPIKEKPVVCDICSKSFTRKRTLKYHMKRHTVKHFYKCQYCTEKFNTKQEQMDHLKEHPNELRPFLCTECGLSFSKNTGFIVHMRRHRGEKPFRCTFCDKCFSRHSDLLQHEHYHTDNKPFICTICGKAFHRRTALKVHTRTHTGERPYKCTYCTKAFTQSNDLKVHIRRHTGEVFKCEFCAASYIQQYLLSKHKLKVHGIKVESISGRLQKFQPINQEASVNAIPVVIKQ